MPGHKPKTYRYAVLGSVFLTFCGAAVTRSTSHAAEPERERVGPLEVSTKGRRTVRGDRPAEQGVHDAWVPPPVEDAPELRASLEAFERASFPVGWNAPGTTLIHEPPEPWMAQLKMGDLPVRWNRRTVEYLRYFKDDPRGQALIRGWLRRMNRYEGRVRAILAELEVPTDLVYVAMIESGFNPAVHSRVGAAGMWQFMPHVAGVYGLRLDFWLDERLDVEKSTYAAALYLKDLHTRYGNWELALAAYNAGYGIINASVERYNTNNYWALGEIESGLPEQTANYVPKLIAAALVGHNPDAFGVPAEIRRSPAPLEWNTVRLRASVRLDELAKTIGADPALIRELNAQLLRGRTPPGRPFPTRIPASALMGYRKAAPALSQHNDYAGTHLVRQGESLSKVAQRHRTSTSKLRHLNGIRDAAEVRAGTTLLLPPSGDAHAPTTKADLRPLAAVPPVDPGPDNRLVFTEVTRATRTSDLEAAFAARWTDIVTWNDLDPSARAHSSQLLQIVVPETFDAEEAGVLAYELSEVEYVIRGSAEHIEASLRRRGLQRRGYKVRRGDTLTKIGKKFGLSLGDVARINGVKRGHTPDAGDLLVVYVPSHKRRGTTRPPAPRGPYDNVEIPERVRKALGAPPRDRTASDRGKSRAKTRSRKTRSPSTATTSRVPTKRRRKKKR